MKRQMDSSLDCEDNSNSLSLDVAVLLLKRSAGFSKNLESRVAEIPISNMQSF